MKQYRSYSLRQFRKERPLSLLSINLYSLYEETASPIDAHTVSGCFETSKTEAVIQYLDLAEGRFFLLASKVKLDQHTLLRILKRCFAGRQAHQVKDEERGGHYILLELLPFKEADDTRRLKFSGERLIGISYFIPC